MSSHTGGDPGSDAMSDTTSLAGRIYAEVSPYTMAPLDSIMFTVRATLEAIEAGRPGVLVECGTWMGGSSFAMLLAQRYRYGRVIKPVWMLDSFEGLPPAQERDGPLAVQWQSDTESEIYFDNCKAPLSAAQDAILSFGFAETECVVVPGWFADTIPSCRTELGKLEIALLRVDCDWYEPVRLVLQELVPFVPEEGMIIIDDYYAWDGCARATHDYLSCSDLSYRIRSMDNLAGAWMIKRANRVDRL